MKHLEKHKTLILFIVFLLAFKNFLIPLYQKFIVNKFLIYADNSTLIDSILILFFIYCCIWTIYKSRKGFFIKTDNLIYSIVGIVMYTIIRNLYYDSLMSFKSIETLKYFDFIYVVCIIPFILFITLKKSKSDNQNLKLQHDNPINKAEQDILGRKSKAIQIFRLLQNNKSKSSIAIGIVGKWGDGKSSFMNLIEENFKNDNSFITIQFNSWLNISVKSIIQDFFNTVEKEIAPLSFDISKELKSYGKNVLSLHKSSTTETILNAVNLLPENSLSDKFTNLNKLLNKLNKRVIVFFDDLDRLQPNEVFEVLKLIRNTASFDVFYYIVGYDKEYINQALKNNQIPNPEKYCEKIFLKEFPLVPITQKEINKYLKTNIIDYLPTKEIEINKIFDNVNLHLDHFEGNVFSSINNIRSAKRYLNELFISIEGIENEIDLKDFIFIKLLKFSYYDVYKLLFYKDKFVSHRDKNEGYYGNEKFNNYKLKQKQKDSIGFSAFSNFKNSILKEEIEKMKIYNSSKIQNIGKILSEIFKDNYNKETTNSLSLAYGKNYYKYFNDEINDSSFLNADFIDFINSDFLKMKEIVNKANENEKLNALMLFIYKLNILEDFSSKKQYENFVQILFYIANLDSLGYKRYFGIDQDFLYETMNNYNNRIVIKFGYKDEDELKAFLQSIFYQEKDYYDFEPDYLKSIYDHYGTSDSLRTPFTKEEIIKYLIFCFNHNSKQIESIDTVFWDCYRLCFIKDWIVSGSNNYSSQINTIEANKQKFLFEIIPKYLDEFLVNIVKPQDWYGEDNNSLKVGISKFVIDLFGSIQGLIDYLKSDKMKQRILEYPSEFINEFLTFVKEFNTKPQDINFKFSYRPVNEKLEQAKQKYQQ